MTSLIYETIRHYADVPLLSILSNSSQITSISILCFLIKLLTSLVVVPPFLGQVVINHIRKDQINGFYFNILEKGNLHGRFLSTFYQHKRSSLTLTCCDIHVLQNNKDIKHSLRLSLKWYQRRLCKSLTQKVHENGSFSANFSVCKSYQYLNIISAITHQKNPELSILSGIDFNMKKKLLL